MKILISSGIYPPDIGGPAQYARNLYEIWKKEGHQVKVAAYRWERAFPSFMRHFLFLLKIIRKGWNADLILVLDTWSAAVPTMYACKLMHKKYVIRTGGDFLWETYVERTGEKVLFKDFYTSCLKKLSRKEKVVFSLGGKALRNAAAIIFSTPWQRDIFTKFYKLDNKKNHIVENYYGPRQESREPESRVFVAGSRLINLKNSECLHRAFDRARAEIKKANLPDIELDTSRTVYDGFLEKIHRAYAVILVSLSEMSPNMIADAIQMGTPFIMTRETGINERVGQAAILVDPLNEDDVVSKIVWLADPKNRASQAQKLKNFNFVHTWEDIAREIVKIGRGV